MQENPLEGIQQTSEHPRVNLRHGHPNPLTHDQLNGGQPDPWNGPNKAAMAQGDVS